MINSQMNININVDEININTNSIKKSISKLNSISKSNTTIDITIINEIIYFLKSIKLNISDNMNILIYIFINCGFHLCTEDTIVAINDHILKHIENISLDILHIYLVGVLLPRFRYLDKLASRSLFRILTSIMTCPYTSLQQHVIILILTRLLLPLHYIEYQEIDNISNINNDMKYSITNNDNNTIKDGIEIDVVPSMHQYEIIQRLIKQQVYIIIYI
jgi:hypothetical protein